jgi:exonuclease VII large subunit
MGLLSFVFRLFLVSICGSFVIAQSDDSLAKLEKLERQFSSVALKIVPSCSNRLGNLSKRVKKVSKNRLKSTSLRQLVREFQEIKRKLSQLVSEVKPICTLEFNPALGLKSVKLANSEVRCELVVAPNRCNLMYIPAAFVANLQVER